jgi:hypothetical protein
MICFLTVVAVFFGVLVHQNWLYNTRFGTKND